MNFRATCWHCRTGFLFDLERTPVQRGPAKRPHLGKIIAFYPTCPRCRAKVEVAETVAARDVETSGAFGSMPTKPARSERTA